MNCSQTINHRLPDVVSDTWKGIINGAYDLNIPQDSNVIRVDESIVEGETQSFQIYSKKRRIIPSRNSSTASVWNMRRTFWAPPASRSKQSLSYAEFWTCNISPSYSKSIRVKPRRNTARTVSRILLNIKNVNQLLGGN